MLLLPERKIRDWQLYDIEEPMGPRESRFQLALLLSKITNRWREKSSPGSEAADFLLQTGEGRQQRQFDKMIGSLASVARPRPAGYKRKRPGHGKRPPKGKRK